MYAEVARESGPVVVFMTAGSQDEANRIARTLVEERLAACVNVIPAVQSVFFWDGKVCEESEFLLVAKSIRSLQKKLEERVKQLHSYQVPEVIVVPIAAGSKDYLEWVEKSVSGPKP